MLFDWIPSKHIGHNFLCQWNGEWSDSSPSISSYLKFNDSPTALLHPFFVWELVFPSTNFYKSCSLYIIHHIHKSECIWAYLGSSHDYFSTYLIIKDLTNELRVGGIFASVLHFVVYEQSIVDGHTRLRPYVYKMVEREQSFLHDFIPSIDTFVTMMSVLKVYKINPVKMYLQFTYRRLRAKWSYLPL